MLVLDHIHQRLHNQLPDETTLHNGQKFDLLGLGLLGVPSLADHFNELQNKLQELKFDVGDYICMKFLLLLNPGNKNVNEGAIYFTLLTLKLFGRHQEVSWCPKILNLTKRCSQHLNRNCFSFLDRSQGHYQPKNCYRRLWKCAGSIIGLYTHMLPICDGERSRINIWECQA